MRRKTTNFAAEMFVMKLAELALESHMTPPQAVAHARKNCLSTRSVDKSVDGERMPTARPNENGRVSVLARFSSDCHSRIESMG